MTEYTHFHIPRAGRHGTMVSIKGDTPFCVRVKELLAEQADDVPEYTQVYWRQREVADDDTCVCEPEQRGAVWSSIMSHEVDEPFWDLFWVQNGDNDGYPRYDDGWLRYEDEMRERIERDDRSYTQGVYPVTIR